MPQFNFAWYDVAPFLAGTDAPHVMLPFDASFTYLVPVSPVLLPEVSCAPVSVGDALRVPMYAYRTPTRSIAAVFGLGTQIGMAALAAVLHYRRDPPAAVDLVLGHECTDLGDCFRCYAGVAVRYRV